MLVGCRPLDPHPGQFEQIAVDSHETTDRLEGSQLTETGVLRTERPAASVPGWRVNPGS